MLIGELIHWTSTANNVYTPAIERISDNMTFNFEVLQITAGTLTIAVQHKYHSEDSSGWVDLASTTTTTTGIKTLSVTAPKEQLRVRFSLTTTGGAAGDFVRGFLYPPIAR